MATPRPFLFVCSSAEGLPVAKALQRNLDHAAEVQIWSQGAFGIAQHALESLITALSKADFCVVLLTPDDVSTSRGKRSSTPRDNLLFELGLSMGILGRDRTYFVYDRTANLRLPSDLSGINAPAYEPPDSGKWESALGAASAEIEAATKLLGSRQKNP